MPVNIVPRCTICEQEKISLEVEAPQICAVCGMEFLADSTCGEGHFVCHMCRQKAVRQSIIAHCLGSEQTQPYPLMLELMMLPDVLMHGPEHHLLLTAALLTAYAGQKGERENLAALLETANARTLQVPGGACGFWGICGAAIGCGIYMSILLENSPYGEEVWKTAGQLTAKCADAIASQGGPRCCKRDSLLALQETIPVSNRVFDTRFALPEAPVCDFFPNNRECKYGACPFFPKKG